MATISLKHLNFGYAGQTPLFEDVTFNFDTHWHLGLVGRNGRGKTTLLRLLQGQLDYTGTINMPLTTYYFPQPISDPTQLTLHALQTKYPFEQWQLEREMHLMGLDIELLWRPYFNLSGGEQTKVQLALLFATDQGFALIDEPTNHLDVASRYQVATYLTRKSGFIVVSHDRDFLDQVCNHILAIDRKNITLFKGNYTTYATAKANQDHMEANQDHHLRKEIDRLKQTAHEKTQWATSREKDKYGNRHIKGSGAVADKGFVGARAARVMQKRKNLERRLTKEIESKSALLQNIEKVPPLTISVIPSHHKSFVHIESLTLQYPDSAPLFKPLSFDVHPGDRVALVGPNGVGKTSFLHALAGNWSGMQEGIMTMPTITMSWLTQQQHLTGTIQSWATAHHLDYQELLNNLKKLGLERSSFTTPIQFLSMGQQKKIALAASLITPANLYVWDEPLNYLDLYNQDQLVTSILAAKPTMLFVEHDQHFIDKVATKIVPLIPQNGD